MVSKELHFLVLKMWNCILNFIAFLDCRMGILGSCFHATMLMSAMILRQTLFRQGMQTVTSYGTSSIFLSFHSGTQESLRQQVSFLFFFGYLLHQVDKLHFSELRSMISQSPINQLLLCILCPGDTHSEIISSG